MSRHNRGDASPKPTDEASFDEAVAAAEQNLLAIREAHGQAHPEVVNALVRLGRYHELQENYPAALRVFLNAKSAAEEVYGPGHWRVTDIRLRVEHVERMAVLDAQEFEQLAEARRLSLQAIELMQGGRYEEALTPVRRSLEIREAVLGRSHPDYLLVLLNLSTAFMGADDPARAGMLATRALAVSKRIYGEEHPSVGMILSNLGMARLERGDFAGAQSFLTQAVDVMGRTVGESAVEYAPILGNLGEAYRRQGRLDEAEPVLRRSALMLEDLGLAGTDKYGTALNNLGLLHLAKGDFTSARTLLHESLAVLQCSVGEEHPNYRATLQSLAQLYDEYSVQQEDRQNWQAAREARTQVLAIRRAAYGAADWRVVDAREALNHLGRLEKLGRDERQALREARKRLEAALRGEGADDAEVLDAAHNLEAMVTRLFGRETLEAADAAQELGTVYLGRRYFDRAEPLLRRVIDIRRNALGEAHPRYAAVLDDLVALYQGKALQLRNQGEAERARAAHEEAVRLLTRRYGENHWRVAALWEEQVESDCLARLDEAQRQRLRDANRLMAEAFPLVPQGQTAEALERAVRAMAVREEFFGAVPVLKANNRYFLAAFFLHAGAPDRAEPLLRECLAIREGLWGEAHPDCVHALRLLAQCVGDLGRPAEAEELLGKMVRRAARVWGEDDAEYANSQVFLGSFYSNQWKFEEARAYLQPAVTTLRRQQGNSGSVYQEALRRLAITYLNEGAPPAEIEVLLRQALDTTDRAQDSTDPANRLRCYHLLRTLGNICLTSGAPDRAEPLLNRALKIASSLQGGDSSLYGTALLFLAKVHDLRGEFKKAENRLQDALRVLEGVQSEAREEYNACLNDLGVVYHHQGDYAQAERCFRNALRHCEERRAERPASYSVTLNNLALLYVDMGDYSRATQALLEASKVWKQAVGEAHAFYANMQNNLALVYDHQGEGEQASRFLRRALEIREEILGREHRDYLQSLSNLGVMHHHIGDHAEAERLYGQALDAQQRILGPTHSETIVTQLNLGTLFLAMGRYEQAEQELRAAGEAWSQTLGEHHPRYALALNRLGDLYRKRGELDQAVEFFRQALESIRPFLEQTLSVQSERQQLLLMQQLRDPLDNYLASTVGMGALDGAAYAQILGWKGIVFARQRWLRLTRNIAEPATADLLTELERTTSRLMALNFHTPEPAKLADWRTERGRLALRREELERDLLDLSPEYRTQQGLCRTADDVRAHLPAGTALVDVFEYAAPGRISTVRADGRADSQTVAFVIRPDRPGVRRIELGSTRSVSEWVDRWRASYGRGHRPTGGQPNPGIELRRLIWEPIAPDLEGVATVLVSPDGALTRLPIAALPGSRPGTFLIEERAVALLPVPQLLPELLRPLSKHGEAAPALLLLGDVDFDAEPAGAIGAVPSPEHRRQSFSPLPGTKKEVTVIQDLYERAYPGGHVDQLIRGQATKAAFLREVPRHRYLHLATHGFFADESARSAGEVTPAGRRSDGGLPASDETTGWHPGLLSAVVFAGANRSEAGLLTALEVAETDLRWIELVVLSACETGLGRVAGGEGLLGLQRAFQVAGARTSVASLWQVPDAATAALMQRFYQHLWQGGNLSKVESLRQAQLWMLWDGGQMDMTRRNLESADGDEPLVMNAPVSPYYWAGFVLSGDWQ